jgi:hypothetical protein
VRILTMLRFDPRGGSTVVHEEPIETDEHTSRPAWGVWVQGCYLPL